MNGRLDPELKAWYYTVRACIALPCTALHHATGVEGCPVQHKGSFPAGRKVTGLVGVVDLPAVPSCSWGLLHLLPVGVASYTHKERERKLGSVVLSHHGSGGSASMGCCHLSLSKWQILIKQNPVWFPTAPHLGKEWVCCSSCPLVRNRVSRVTNPSFTRYIFWDFRASPHPNQLAREPPPCWGSLGPSHGWALQYSVIL